MKSTDEIRIQLTLRPQSIGIYDYTDVDEFRKFHGLKLVDWDEGPASVTLAGPWTSVFNGLMELFPSGLGGVVFDVARVA